MPLSYKEQNILKFMVSRRDGKWLSFEDQDIFKTRINFRQAMLRLCNINPSLARQRKVAVKHGHTYQYRLTRDGTWLSKVYLVPGGE